MGLSPTFTFVCRVQNPPFSEEGGKNHSESEHSLAKMFITLWGKMHDSLFMKNLSVVIRRLDNFRILLNENLNAYCAF